MRAPIFLLINVLCIYGTLAQSNIAWEKTYGGTDFDFAGSIRQTPDGGYVFLGGTSSNDGDVTVQYGEGDFWLVKITASGAIEWQKTIGGTKLEFPKSLQLTNDGGYFIVGYSESSDGDIPVNYGLKDYCVIKLNATGDIEWQKNYGGSQDDYGNFGVQTADGGYMVVGMSVSNDQDVSDHHDNPEHPFNLDYWLVKMDQNGAIQWTKSLGGNHADYGQTIQQTDDGGYIVIGFTQSTDGDVSFRYGVNPDNTWDAWLVKLDATGEIQWDSSLGGSQSDRGIYVEQTSEGGYIVAGTTTSNDFDVSGFHGISDCWILKLHSDGTIDWQKSLGGSSYDYGFSVTQTNDGGYIVSGQSSSNDGDVSGFHVGNNLLDPDLWVLKLNAVGELQWQKALGGTAEDRNGSCVIQAEDGGYVVVGLTRSTDGDVSSIHGDADCWIVKLASSVGTGESTGYQQLNRIEISPNPAQESVNITLQSEDSTFEIVVTNLLGIEVVRKNMNNESQLDVTSLPKGIYAVTAVSASGLSLTGKLCKQ